MDTMGFEPGPSAPEPDEMPTHHVPSGDAGTDAAQSAEREALNLVAMGSSPTVGVLVTPFIPELALGCHAQCGEARMLWKSPASGRTMLSISLPSHSVNPSPPAEFLVSRCLPRWAKFCSTWLQWVKLWCWACAEGRKNSRRAENGHTGI